MQAKVKFFDTWPTIEKRELFVPVFPIQSSDKVFRASWSWSLTSFAEEVKQNLKLPLRTGDGKGLGGGKPKFYRYVKKNIFFTSFFFEDF